MKPSFTSIQALVGLTAGMMSIAGGVYSAVRSVKPAAGEVVAVVREVGTEKIVPGATVDILTPQDALVTSLIPTDDGRARRTLQQGTYRVRVAAPQFGAETRDVEIRPGETVEVRMQLAHQPPPAAAASRPARGHAVSRGVGHVQRFFQNLGL